LQPLDLLGYYQPTSNPAFDSIEKFQPVFQRRFGNFLPLLRPALSRVKNPAVSDMPNIDLDTLAIMGPSRPGNVAFRHALQQLSFDPLEFAADIVDNIAGFQAVREHVPCIGFDLELQRCRIRFVKS